MATTNLFVELLVIGVGAACWVFLLILTAFGVEIFQVDVLKIYPIFPPLLAVLYLLGIISDRLADFVFDQLFSRSLRNQFFAQKRDYQDARRLIYSSSGRLADMHEYGRSRIRVCRGWCLNAVLIAICLNVLLQSRFTDAPWHHNATTWGTAGCLILALTSWWSWRILCITEYLKIREHADFLSRRESKPELKLAA
jgi:hypothetical protein